jgi:hypothetical protein
MQDKKMKALGLLTALSLAVCLIASGIVSDTDSSYAATSSLKWTQIPIPDEDDMQLYPGSDVGPMAVSPDGSAVFAAANSSGVWSLLKSIDQAFTWQGTGLSAAMATMVDTGAIVVVKLSPNWNVDGFIFVATENSVYYSDDRGRTFEAMATDNLGTIFDAGTDVITSLDIGEHDDFPEGLVVAVGTRDPLATVGGGVYVFNGSAWEDQSVGTYDVLAVGLSPSYATDETIVAVVSNSSDTVVRTKYNTWDAIVSPIITDSNGSALVSYRACIGFPSDFNPVSFYNLSVGLSAVAPGGDVFRIVVSGGSGNVTDLDVSTKGASPSSVNIWSIAVSGSSEDAVLLAGAESPTVTAYGSIFVFGVMRSGSGWIWTPDSAENKQPTGEARATVIKTNSATYVGTSGNQSAVSVALGGVYTSWTSWNQRGLIDTVIDDPVNGGITDMSPSGGYFADGTMYITTMDTYTDDASLWYTQTEGRTWERVYCSTLTGSTCIFDMVRLGPDVVIVAERDSRRIWRSSDNCESFSNRKGTVEIGAGLPGGITAFAVGSNSSAYYAGDANGHVSWYDDSTVTWSWSSASEIPTSDSVVDLVLTDDGDIYAGTNQGGVYKASDTDFTFVQVGPDTPGAPGDIVHVAPDLYDTSYVYAGIQGGAASQGIWRFDQSDDEAQWEHIADAADVGDISSLACDSEYGMLYAVSVSTGTGWRSINPRTAKGDPLFEEIHEGLGVGDSVVRNLHLVSAPILLFAVGGASYTQIWITSDEMVRMKLLSPEDGSESEGMILDVEDEAFLGRAILELKWKEIQGADSYEVQIGYDEGLDSPVEDMSYYAGGTPYADGTVKTAYLWPGSRYYWRVRVVAPYMSQWSDTWSFTTPLGLMISMPELLSPLPGQENVYLRPALQWSSCVDATGYELILAMNCDWENPVLNLSGEDAISNTAYQLMFSLAKNTDYCWKVRGVNDITHSPWSDSLSFTTGVIEQVEDEGLPVWVWVIVALAAVFMLSILVLIMQSRKY